MKKTNQLLILLSGLLFIFGVSCNSGGDSSNNDKLKIDSADRVNVEKAATILYSLPAPVDIASVLIDHPGSKFNQEILNPASNAPKYNSNKSLALNLGIYTADLSYASFFEQKQVTLNYISVTKKMAEDLGIINSIDESKIKKISETKIDKENMQKIISETFMNTDSYLLENNRPEIMTMILIGGWIEAQYLATALTKGSVTENPELVQRIMEQSLTLELMFSLFEDFKNDVHITEIKTNLTKVKQSYDKMNTELTPKNFKEFCEVIEDIRNDYTI